MGHAFSTAFSDAWDSFAVTVATIRQNHLNRWLGVTADADTIPWTTTDRDAFIVDALIQTWPDVGKRAAGTVALSGSSDVYTLPAALTGGRVSRVELESVSPAAKIDRVVNWIPFSDTQIRVGPLLATDASAQMRVFGFVPFQTDASDLPTRLEPIVAMRAAALAYGQLASQLVNYKRQQGLDSARVVDYQTAVGLSAYWERRYFEAIAKDQAGLSYAPRRARR